MKRATVIVVAVAVFLVLLATCPYAGGIDMTGMTCTAGDIQLENQADELSCFLRNAEQYEATGKREVQFPDTPVDIEVLANGPVSVSFYQLVGNKNCKFVFVPAYSSKIACWRQKKSGRRWCAWSTYMVGREPACYSSSIFGHRHPFSIVTDPKYAKNLKAVSKQAVPGMFGVVVDAELASGHRCTYLFGVRMGPKSLRGMSFFMPDGVSRFTSERYAARIFHRSVDKLGMVVSQRLIASFTEQKDIGLSDMLYPVFFVCRKNGSITSFGIAHMLGVTPKHSRVRLFQCAGGSNEY